MVDTHGVPFPPSPALNHVRFSSLPSEPVVFNQGRRPPGRREHAPGPQDPSPLARVRGSAARTTVGPAGIARPRIVLTARTDTAVVA